MGFFNIGKKDEYLKQRRIEHRGKHLRASRTGGVALRAQAKALGANVTANTQQGLRVSTTPLKYTQIALQNGRFVLRGRYGSGPLRLNLSKTGVSVSTRNRLGSFNWLKPNRSSAKILGIQSRGKNAAVLQTVYMLVAAVGLLLRLLAGFLRLVGTALALGYRLKLAAPYAWRGLLRKYRNKRLAKEVARHEALLGPQLDTWKDEQLIAAALLVLAAWGRGRGAVEAASVLERTIAEEEGKGPLHRSRAALPDVAQNLETYRATELSGSDGYPAALALIARRLPRRLSERELPEVLLQADEIALRDGERTVLQERMLEVFADFAGLQLLEEEGDKTEEAAGYDAEEEGTSEPEPAEDSHGADDRIDLNTASFEALQSLPHIGPERAKAITEQRPWSSIDELQQIDGIGPRRLEAIRELAVVGESKQKGNTER